MSRPWRMFYGIPTRHGRLQQSRAPRRHRLKHTDGQPSPVRLPPDTNIARELMAPSGRRAGEHVQCEIVASLHDHGDPLPILILFADWSERQRDWRSRDLYQVEEIPTGIDGRAFLLHRDPAAIAQDGPDADRCYGVFVHRNGQDHLCECKGFASHGRCKHVDALRGLIETGRLEHPMAGAPAPEWPSPEQVDADAKNEAPF